ncbi:MAG: hypothetical protein LBG09_01205 [Puniceicoccales bacterium]|nr:hypothetical protein [Puniceicoccales bacterium]
MELGPLLVRGLPIVIDEILLIFVAKGIRFRYLLGNAYRSPFAFPRNARRLSKYIDYRPRQKTAAAAIPLTQFAPMLLIFVAKGMRFRYLLGNAY